MMIESGYKKDPNKKLKNLNWIIDSYQHIPTNFNNTQKQLNSDHPDKPYFTFYRLTNCKPNKWVEEKPPQKPVKKLSVKKSFEIGLKLKLKKYSSTPELLNELQKRRQKLKEELMRLSSVRVFQNQITSPCYSKYERKILKSVKNNALQALTLRIGQGKFDQRQSPLYRLSKLDLADKEFQTLMKKQHQKSARKSNHAGLLAIRKRGFSVN